MNKPKIVFRADGGSKVGMGHFTRTLALAEMLREDFHCTFALQTPSDWQIQEIENTCHEWIGLPGGKRHFPEFLAYLSGTELVVLDNYYFDTDYQYAVRAKGCKLVCIDDIHNRYFAADVVINHAPSIDPNMYCAAPYTELRLGLDYVLLRKPFLACARSAEGKSPSRFAHVLLCFGGADFANLTKRLLLNLVRLDEIKKISIVIGSAYEFFTELEATIASLGDVVEVVLMQAIDSDQMLEVIRSADFAIVPSSTVLYEVLALHKPVITGYYVDNQIEICRGMEGRAGVVIAGDFNSMEVTDRHLRDLRANPPVVGAAGGIDGKSAERLGRVFRRLALEQEVCVRRASMSDMDLYFRWANDGMVRGNSIHRQPIPYADHVKWFQEKLRTPAAILLLFEYGDKPIGQVRFDLVGEEASIDYSVDASYRGMGLGTTILKLAIEYFVNNLMKDHVHLRLKAVVKDDNNSSERIFRKFRFVRQSSEMHAQDRYVIYTKQVL